MREYSRPSLTETPDKGNLTDDVVRNGTEHPGAVALLRASATGTEAVTAATFLDQVRATAKGLLASGVGNGDRIALWSRTRYEWTLVDYATWFAGAVSVPIYETASPDQIEWILSDSGARGVFVDTAEHRRRLEAVESGTPGYTQVWSFDEGAIEALIALGRDVTDAELEDRRTSATPVDPATIIYTSGTTGRPKGCTLSHGNFMATVDAAVGDLKELFDQDGASTLLFLPLAHVFARVIQIGAIRTRVRLGHSSSIQTLTEDMRAQRPTFIVGVPRIFEKIFTTTSQNAAADGRGRRFDQAATAAIRYSEALDGGTPGLALRTRHALFDRLVYSRLRASLGGRCDYLISGGAPLGERLAHFYRGIGLTVLEGYGLTETTGAVCVNSPKNVVIGSVGRPLPGTELRVAPDGELLARGPQIFTGYWQDPESPEEAVTPDGWLRTGDLAEIDDEGFVRVTGRKKEMLITAGGKNVAPATLEERVRAHPLVSQCMVVGDGEPYVAALITLDAPAAEAWAARHGKPADLGRLVDDPAMRSEIQTAVDHANAAVSRAESIRAFRLLAADWTEDAGHLTPSLKLRRHAVMRDFRTQIDTLYR